MCVGVCFVLMRCGYLVHLCICVYVWGVSVYVCTYMFECVSAYRSIEVRFSKELHSLCGYT